MSDPGSQKSTDRNADTPRSHSSGVGRAWTRLKAVFSDNGDTSLRESLEDVIEQHDSSKDSFTPEERSMLHNILEFGALRVEDVMVPRADIVAVDQTISISELITIFRDAGHSRLPVFDDTLDDPVGMVHIKDVMGWMTTSATGKTRSRKATKNGQDTEKAPVKAQNRPAGTKPSSGPDMSKVDLSKLLSEARIRREVLFVPPSMPAIDLLAKMQTTRIHMAVVIDEYGGTDGLVSIEDLVEEIVGDIEDEHDTDDSPLIIETENGYDVDARLSIEELEEKLGFEVVPSDREEDVDTLGGLVFSMVGRVPVRGELIRHESGIEFEVQEGDARRLKKLRIHLVPKDINDVTIRQQKPAASDTATPTD